MNGKLAALLATALLAAATVATARHELALLRANRVLWVAESQAAALAAQAARQRPLIARNLAGLRRAHESAPADSRIPHAIGSYYLLLDQLGQAETWYRRALELEPRAETYLNLARVVERRDRRDEAAELYRRAVALTPALFRQVPAWAADAMPESARDRSGRRQ